MSKLSDMKNQAMKMAQKAQESGKAKYEGTKAKHHADQLVRQLGALSYAKAAGKAPDDVESQMAELVKELAVLEKEQGVVVGSAPPEEED